MAKKTTAEKPKAAPEPKAAPAPAPVEKAKPAEDKMKPMPKSAVYKELATRTGLETKQVVAVFEAMDALIKEQLKIGKKTPGEFVVPGLMKLKLIKKPATKAGTRTIAGQVREVKAKPAFMKVKVVVLKGLKEVAAK